MSSTGIATWGQVELSCLHCVEVAWLNSNNNFHTVLTASSPALLDLRRQYQCLTSYAAVHYIVLLMMGILMPKTCWAKEQWINFICVASSWFTTLPKMKFSSHRNRKTFIVLFWHQHNHLVKENIYGYMNIICWMFHELYTNTSFKPLLEHVVYTDLTLVCVKECT
jgi:hypothetical protein